MTVIDYRNLSPAERNEDEQATVLLVKVQDGHRPSMAELDLLHKYIDSRRIGLAIALGMWAALEKPR